MCVVACRRLRIDISESQRIPLRESMALEGAHHRGRDVISGAADHVPKEHIHLRRDPKHCARIRRPGVRDAGAAAK